MNHILNQKSKVETMKTKPKSPRTVEGVFRMLDEYAKDDKYIFRGQSNSEYLLKTSYARHTCFPYDINNIIESFRSGMARLGIEPIQNDDPHFWLEYARHHGVPTPCHDFTYSPYVALFFAFNGIRVDYSKLQKSGNVVIYVLNTHALASAIALIATELDTKKEKFSEEYRQFLYPQEPLFKGGYPVDRVMLIPYPSKYNRRMQKQMGLLLYDSIDYTLREENNFEEYLIHLEDTQRKKKSDLEPILKKIYVKKAFAQSIFEKLELMGICGESLFGDSSGIVMDILNAYHYNPKTKYLRDIKSNSEDSGKNGR